MKTLIQFVMVALVFGGLSAAVTVFTQMKTAVPTLASSESDAVKPDQPAKPVTPAATSPAAEHVEEAKSEHPDDTTSEESAPAPGPAPASTARVVPDSPEPGLRKSEPHPVPPASPLPQTESRPGASTSEAGKLKETPVAVRPPYVPEGDEAGALINMLRERARNTADAERRLAERQDAMQLIFDDLRAEQMRTLKIRQRLSGELKASRQEMDTALQIIDEERVAMRRDLEATRKAADDAVRAANEERDKIRKQLEQPAATSEAADGPRSNDTAGPPEDNVNLKKMAAVFDSMPAENVSKVFEQLVKNKRPDAVVALMNAMKERQAAKVLGIIAETNPALAADLTERLKRLKTSTAKPADE